MSLSNSKNKPETGKFWFLFLILGIVSVGLGIYFMMNFGAGFEFIALVVAIYFLVTGVVNLFSAINERGTQGWLINLILSIVAFIVGVLIITDYFTSWMVSISEFMVLIICGIGLVSDAISLIFSAIALRKEAGSSWIFTLILGIILFIVSVVIIANPLYSIALINIFVSIAVLIFGVTTIVLSFQHKKIRDTIKNQQ